MTKHRLKASVGKVKLGPDDWLGGLDALEDFERIAKELAFKLAGEILQESFTSDQLDFAPWLRLVAKNNQLLFAITLTALSDDGSDEPVFTFSIEDCISYELESLSGKECSEEEKANAKKNLQNISKQLRATADRIDEASRAGE